MSEYTKLQDNYERLVKVAEVYFNKGNTFTDGHLLAFQHINADLNRIIMALMEQIRS